MERIPILKMGEFLLVTIQVDMHDRLALQLQEDLTERIAATRASGVLIDISSLEMVDSFIGRMMGNIAGMSKVLGAETVVTGMQPSVAITLVELGLSLKGVRTALNVERGMDLLRASLRGGVEDLWRPRRSGLTGFRSARPKTSCVVRQHVRKLAVELGFSLVDQTKMVTAASEIARNTLIYGQRRMGDGRDGGAGGTARAAGDVRGPGSGDRGHRSRVAGRFHDGERVGPGARRREAAVQRFRDPIDARGRHSGSDDAMETVGRRIGAFVYAVAATDIEMTSVSIRVDTADQAGEARRRAATVAAALGLDETTRGGWRWW